MKLRLALSLITAVCVLLAAWPARAQETAAMVGQLKTLGARADGVHDDTAAIQKAIDRVHINGGGTVIFPPGRYRITGEGINLRNNVTLRGVDARDSVLLFDQSDPKQYAINLVNNAGEYCPMEQMIRDLRIVTSGGGAVRDRGIPWTDGQTRGLLGGGIRDVVIEGGARNGYAIDLGNHYCQRVLLENILFVDFLGPAVRIDGNANVLRRVNVDSFAAGNYANADALPMVSIAGDGNTFEQSILESFSGCPALKLTGDHHAVTRLWAETDGGKIPGGEWIVLDDAHHVLFDWPHLLNPATQKLVLRNGSDATAIMLEPKHVTGSVDVDKTSSLTVIVPERSMTPGVHVITHPGDGLELPDGSDQQP